MKPRLKRLGRLYKDYPVYFITACTHDRQRVLANHEIHQAFSSFALAGEERHVFMGRYVLMPDHFHCFVVFGLDSEQKLPFWMKSLKNCLSKTLRRRGVSAPHWQKGFFDHVLRSGESHAEKSEYVRENPVRAGLVKTSEDWPYQGQFHPLTF